MNNIIRVGRCLTSIMPRNYGVRSLSTTQQLRIKEYKTSNTNGSIVIEAVTIPSPRESLLVKPISTEVIVNEEKKPLCYMCALGLDVKHTDVLILSQFLRSDGCMLPKRITGLCNRQQKRITQLVAMAQKAGLMINLTPSWCKKDPKKRYGFKKFNTYFDEATIMAKKPPKWTDRFKYRERAK